MNDFYATLIVAGVGVLIQAVAGYGTFKFFTGRVEERFRGIDYRLTRLDASQRDQWGDINKNSRDLEYVRGQLSKPNGKGAGAS